MKNKLLYIGCLFLIFIMIADDVDAQRRRKRPSYRRRSAYGGLAIKLHSIDFNTGFYKPSMDYWNNESDLAANGKSFDGGLMFQGGVELDVYNGFLVGLYGGYYSDKVSSYSNIGGIERNADLIYRHIPLSLQLKQEFTFGDPRSRYRNTGIARFHPYIGGGVNFTLIRQKQDYEFTDPDRDDDAFDFVQSFPTITFSGIVGAKYDITQYFGVGVEMNYYIGSHEQPIAEAPDEKVSLTGPSFNGKLYLKFPSGPSRSRYSRAKRR